jgi:DNA-directed RNA polymerase specialized sigma24 family protein
MDFTSTPGSVTQWLGTPESHSYPTRFELLWQRFGVRLVRLARRQLRQAKDPAYEAEDLAVSTFQAFYQNAIANSFARPANREQLWNLLSKISLNKTRNFRKQLARQKRIPMFARKDISLDRIHWHNDESTNSPAMVSMIADQCEFLLRLLDEQDPKGELKTIALMRLDGASKSQIAKALGNTRFTISARINLIQAIWQHHLNGQSN